MTDYSHENFATDNTDGSITLDAYAGKSREELKQRCRDLCRAVDEWQHIAIALAEHGQDGLTPHQRDKVTRLIEAYAD